MPRVMCGQVWLSKRLQDESVRAEFLVQATTHVGLTVEAQVEGASVPDALRKLAHAIEQEVAA